MTDELEIKYRQDQYLNRADEIGRRMDALRSKYENHRHALKKELADLIEDGKMDADLSVADVAKRLGKTRQSINKIVIDIYGIRHEDKAAAAKLGHTKSEVKKNENVESV